MTHQVRILPSGHDFIVEGNSSLLEAGLRAGLRLSYGCSNGNCGACRAKVISGKVEKTRHHDYRVGEADKLNGHVLMCCHTAMSDVVMEAPEASSANEVPQQQIIARVKDVRLINEDVALVHLRTPRTNRLRFLAGQHVQLGGNGIPLATQSVGSCPCDDMHLHFQVPRINGDEFSDYVFTKLRSGESLEVNGPDGDFILDEDSPRPLVFIAWHTGFAPVRSLIEHAMALEVAESIHLVWVAASKEDRYFDNLCRSWADAFDDFFYVPVDANLSDGLSDAGSEIFERINIERQALVEYDYYIAGNENLLNDCSTSLLDAGLEPAQLNTDKLIHD